MITHISTTRLNEKGGSLIALSFLMLVLSVMGTTGLYLYQKYNGVQDDQTSIDQSREIQDAIAAFVSREGRYPCPAPLNAKIDSAQFGKEISTNCLSAPVGTGTFKAIGRGGETVRIGAVPTRALNLSDNMMVDGHNKRYVYAVTERMATIGTDPYAEHGVITVQNAEGHDLSAVGGHAIFALLSYGEDSRGAYDIDGNLITACDVTADAGQNCQFQTTANTPATFVTTLSKNYNKDEKGLEHSYAFAANEIPYRWNTGPWSECDGDCYSGTQSRDVTCRNLNNGEIVQIAEADLNNANKNPCIHTARPQPSRVCGLGPCTWQAGSYGQCQASGNVRIPDRRNCKP